VDWGTKKKRHGGNNGDIVDGCKRRGELGHANFGGIKKARGQVEQKKFGKSALITEGNDGNKAQGGGKKSKR